MAILTGLFSNKDSYKSLETDLANAGFNNADFIVYLNDNESDYLASVSVNNDAQAEKADEMMNKNYANKTYLFEDMSIDEAKNYEQLRKMIEARADTEIKEAPNLTILESDDGMDRRVQFGKPDDWNNK